MISLFFNKTVTLNEETSVVGADGSHTLAEQSGPISIMGSFQPMSATEAVKYQREEGTVVATLYIPRYYSGTELFLYLNQTVEIDGDTYRIVGPPITDPYGNNLIKMVVEQEL